MDTQDLKNLEKYPIDESWVGEFDYEDVCYYNSGVCCPRPRHCENCGFNMFVSMYRIQRDYGEGAIDYLSMNQE